MSKSTLVVIPIRFIRHLSFLLFCVFLSAQNVFADNAAGGDGSQSVSKAVEKGITTVGGSGTAPLPDLFIGSMSQSIPIEVPPGRNGLKPDLALSYRSNSGNSWVGVGWDLEVGVIERSIRNGIDYNGDNFIFAGSSGELVHIDTGNEYRAKYESAFLRFQKLTIAGSGGSDTTWLVTAKNGTKYYFGQTSETRLHDPDNAAHEFKWYLDKIEDTNGNVITFSYFKDTDFTVPNNHWSQIYLDHIDYGVNRIKLWREDRTDKVDTYTANFNTRTNFRLKTIDIVTNGQQNKVVKLSYATSVSTSRSILQSVQQFGSDAIIDQGSGNITNDATASKTPAQNFAKLVDSTGFSLSPNFGMSINTAFGGWNLLGDFNGDGKMDVMSLLTASTASVNYSNGGSFDALPYSGMHINTAASSWNLTGDFDGDGKTDLLTVITGTEVYPHYAKNGFIPSLPYSNLILNTYITGEWNYVGDFNGDGKADVLAILTASSACINYSTGTGFTNDCHNNLQLNAARGGWNLVGDFDGDGKMDILSIHTATTGYIHYAKNNFQPESVSGLNFNPAGSGEWNRVGDFNGDGKADVLSMLTVSTASVHYSTGSGFKPASYANMQINTAGGGWNLVGDFNGDGKADLLSLMTTNSGKIHYSTGSGFNIVDTSSLYINTGGTEWNMVGDFEGNGKSGLLTVLQATSCHLNRSSATLDLIESFSNGLGGSTHINYTPSTQYANTQLPFPVQTVSSIETNDGNGNVSKTWYSYSGGFFHIGERDFRGFNAVSVWGPVSDGKQTRSTTWFHQGNDTEIVSTDNPYGTVGYTKGKPYRTKTWGVTGVVTGNENVTLDSSNLISETTTSYQSPSSSVNPPFFTPPLQVDNYLYDGGGQSSHTKSIYVLYDSYGNITREERYGGPDSPTNKLLNMTITSSYLPNTTAWIVGLPATESVYQAIGTADANKISQTDYYYDDLTDCSTTPTYTHASPVKGNLNHVSRWLKDGTSPESRTAYDDYGNPKCSRDPNGNVTSIGFDGTYQTFPASSTNAKSQVTTSTYYGVGIAADKGLFGQLKSITDPNNATSTFEYDLFGRKTKESQPDSFWTQTAYNSFGTVGSQNISTSNQLGLWSASYFDGLGRTFKVRRSGPDNKVIVTETAYDPRGQVSRVSLPYFEGLETPLYRTYSYDVQGRVTTTANPDSTSSLACYNGLVTVRIDENGHRRRETRDPLGRLIKVDEYEGVYTSCDAALAVTPYATTTYSYDVLGNLTGVTDANQKSTQINYDTLGRKKNMTDPDMGYWQYGYYPDGSLYSITDAKGQIITYDIDVLNRPTLKHYPAGSGIADGTYVYDETTSTNPKGRLTKMLDGSGSTTYNYDLMGRPTRTVKRVDNTDYTIVKAYDGIGRISGITYPDNESITYGYDNGGNLSEVSGYAEYDEYNALGQPGKLYYGNGIITSYWYYPLNYRLFAMKTDQLQTPLLYKTYNYDKKGNVAQVIDLASTAIPHTAGNGSIGYTYWPDNAHRIQTASTSPGRTYLYDDNGNITSDGIRTITYTPDNMPQTVTMDSSTATFTYDGNNKRVKKNGLYNRIYIGKLHECSADCGNYIYAGNTRIAKSTPTATHFYHGDHLGSTAVVTDGIGDKIEDIAYYPFGETRQDSGSANLNHKYTGQELDVETGLYNYDARLYDPEIGRFISADSIVPSPGNPQSLNRYSYVLNNPLIYTDPTGHSWHSKQWRNFLKADVTVAILAAAAISGNWWAITGTLSGAAIGGYSASKNGGNVWNGMLFGSAVGVVTGSFAGVANAGAKDLTSLFFENAYARGIAGGIASGTISGAGTGATTGYGGGTGNMGTILTGMGKGAAYGAAIGGALGAAETYLLAQYKDTMSAFEDIEKGISKSAKTGLNVNLAPRYPEWVMV